MQTLTNLTTISDRSISFNNFKVDPLFYSLRKARWDIFLTFHYEGEDYYLDNEFAEKNRRVIIKKVIVGTLKYLHQPRNDIQFAGFTEKKNGRCHTHTALHIKDKSPICAETIADTIKILLPQDIIRQNPRDKEKQVEIIRDPERIAAYISKFNSNDLKIHKTHFSSRFFEWINNGANLNPAIIPLNIGSKVQILS